MLDDDFRAQPEWTVRGVEPCDCLDHARVVLAGGRGQTCRVRVDAAAGQAIIADLAGVPGSAAPYADILRAVLRAFGADVIRVECALEDDASCAAIHIQAADSAGVIRPVSVGPALVLAVRLRAPISLLPTADGVPTPRGETIPEAFREVLEALDFGDH